MDLVILLVVAILLILMGVPVGLVLAFTDIVALALSGLPLTTVMETAFSSLNNPLLLAVPFFIMTGSLMSRSSGAARLTDFLTTLVQWIRGGLGMSAVISSVFFADISGSAVADTAAIGSIMIPALVRRGYAREYSTALQAASGSLGLMFPPSLTQIIYAFVAGISISQLFLASIAPGILVAASFIVINYFVARRRGYEPGKLPTRASVWVAFRRAAWVLAVPVIILGGILKGVFTATEAGAVAVVYIVLVEALVHRDLTWRVFGLALRDTAQTTARVGLLVCMALILGTILGLHLIPQQVLMGLQGVTTDRLLVLLLVNVVFMVMHTMLEASSAILIAVPVVLPLLHALNIDPIQFGVILFVNSAIGLTLPPLGFALYIACSISKVRLERATIAMVPFTVALLVDLAIVSIFPQISLGFVHSSL